MISANGRPLFSGSGKILTRVTRLAYSGFEYWLSGWIYDGAGPYTENGGYDMVHTGKYAYGFDSQDQWLITPRIRIPDNDNTELRVWAKMLNSGKQCGVLLSQNDTVRSSFTHELGTIAPHNEEWAEYTFNLKNYKNSDVYLAFNYDETGGYIVVDDLTVSMPKAETSIDRDMPKEYALLDVYPNPLIPKQLSGMILQPPLMSA
ncbi:MAG: choice-of-anchor J domain-containing protein [Candidatus Marinimicrobia bacterium]|nr:choice-of-anchor J domain-containing protein [Candidatus Neomarinimicrobiota bacterium]